MDVSVILSKYPHGYEDQDKIYNSVETALYNLGLDVEHYGTREWNPLRSIVSKGDKVVIKPNLVLHHNSSSVNIDAVVCNSATIRPIVDYVLKALDGTGKLIIADAPQGDANFDLIIQHNGLKQLQEDYRQKGFDIEIRDLRNYYYPGGFYESTREKRDGDPDGYTEFALGDESYLSDVKYLDRLYGSDFNRSFIVSKHKDGKHRYKISNTVLFADVVISMPKLKTHQKTGMTVNLKNLVGINGDKNYLAHYRIGSPSQGGDEYPDTSNIFLLCSRWIWSFSKSYLLSKNTMWGRRLYNYVFKYLRGIFNRLYKYTTRKQIITTGGWYGNDTCWRMCLDLNYILRYTNNRGQLQDTPTRKYLCIVDGIIGGEEDGPLAPTEKKSGVIIASQNPYYADYVCAYIMGFDPNKVPFLKNCQMGHRLPELNFEAIDTICMSNNKFVNYRDINLHFKPQDGWLGFIER